MSFQFKQEDKKKSDVTDEGLMRYATETIRNN